MLKKTITYTDFDDNERTEDYYFNLTQAEVMEMEMSTNGGMEKMLQKIVAEHNGARMVEVFKDIITRAYGEKSLDGKHFMKSPELTDKFVHTEAYSELFIELVTNAEAAAAFCNGIIPQRPVAANTPTLTVTK